MANTTLRKISKPGSLEEIKPKRGETFADWLQRLMKLVEEKDVPSYDERKRSDHNCSGMRSND